MGGANRISHPQREGLGKKQLEPGDKLPIENREHLQKKTFLIRRQESDVEMGHDPFTRAGTNCQL